MHSGGGGGGSGGGAWSAGIGFISGMSADDLGTLSGRAGARGAVKLG